jgi:glycosyltransferase involved in cell wall biosynthesis
MAIKKTIHFVYATPFSQIDDLQLKIFKQKLWRPTWEQYKWPAPIQAPLSITYHVARRLSAKFRVKLYDLRERVDIEPENGDVLLGHIWPDTESVVWRALRNSKFHKKYLIGPYNNDPRQLSWASEAVENCDRYFAISGRYWIDTLHNSPIKDIQKKIVHLNMAIDANDYPMVKTSFNPPGKRKFFYIGRIGEEKGVDILEKFAESVPGFKGGYLCVGGDIRGWERISEPRKLTPEFMKKVAEEYDVFINMSRADAQVTTVLEAMSWGFPVACTKESGYTEEDFFYMDLLNEEENVRRLTTIQQLSSEELCEISRINREIVETKYNWDTFLSILENNL